MAVDRQDEIAWLQAGLFCGGSAYDATAIGVNLNLSQGQRRSAHSQKAVFHFETGAQRLDDPPDGGGHGYRKALGAIAEFYNRPGIFPHSWKCRHPFCFRILFLRPGTSGGRQPDHFSPAIQERAPATSHIATNVGLQERPEHE